MTVEQMPNDIEQTEESEELDVTDTVTLESQLVGLAYARRSHARFKAAIKRAEAILEETPEMQRVKQMKEAAKTFKGNEDGLTTIVKDMVVAAYVADPSTKKVHALASIAIYNTFDVPDRAITEAWIRENAANLLEVNWARFETAVVDGVFKLDPKYATVGTEAKARLSSKMDVLLTDNSLDEAFDDDGRSVIMIDGNLQEQAHWALEQGHEVFYGQCPYCESEILSVRGGTRSCMAELRNGACGTCIVLEPYAITAELVA